MKPAPFVYEAPDTLEAALATLGEHGDEAKILAGGQSLIPAMNFRLMQPEMLVDINKLSELDYLEKSEEGGLRIGGMVRQARLGADELVRDRAPLLHESIPHIAHPQIRNRGTLGGSLVHADPAAELPVVMLALGARFKVQSAEEERWIPVEEFYYGMFATDMMPEEILVEVEVPAFAEHSGWSFLEVARRKGDYAMMGVAAVVGLDGEGKCKTAKLVYLNAGDGAVEAQEAAEMLQGEAVSEALFEAAAEKAADEEIDPMGNVHASIAYQRQLAKTLTKRALGQAFERAKNGKGTS